MITDFKENLPIIIKKFDSKKDKREIIKILKSLASDDSIISILNFRENVSGGFYFDVIREHVKYVHQTPTIDRYIITFNKENNPVEGARELTLKWLRIITKILNKNKNLYPIENFNKKFLEKSIDRPEYYIYPFDDFGIGYFSLEYLYQILKTNTGISDIIELFYHCKKINYRGRILIMLDKSFGDIGDIAQKIHDYLVGIGRYDILLGDC